MRDHRWMEVIIGGTLAGLPVVNLPAGFDQQGRPMGMQVMGRLGEDQKVLEFAMAYELVTDHLTDDQNLSTRTRNFKSFEKSCLDLVFHNWMGLLTPQPIDFSPRDLNCLPTLQGLTLTATASRGSCMVGTTINHRPKPRAKS